MEVDLYPYTKMQQRVSKGKRSKRKRETQPKQNNLNDKNARRYLNQLINGNFKKNDYHVTCTYREEFLPETLEDAEKEVRNFLRRISYRMKKANQELKYILVTEYSTKRESDKPVRIHHHITINQGLSRDDIENLWTKPKEKGKKHRESIGFINTDRLQPDENGLSALSNYLAKHPRGKKRWSSSRNLVRPESRTNDHKYSRRGIEKVAKNQVDKDYWEKKYPGWKITSSDYGIENVYNEQTGWSIYLKFRRKDIQP